MYLILLEMSDVIVECRKQEQKKMGLEKDSVHFI